MQVRVISLFIKTMLLIMAVNWLTFFVVLPKLCKNLAYSMYYNPPSDPYDNLNERNDKRTKEATGFFESISGSHKFVPYNYSERQHSKLEFSLVVVSVKRRADPHYLLQVVARLLPQVQRDQDRSKLIILNVDKEPAVNEDAVYLSKYVRVVSRGMNSLVAQDTFEKEKEDYVMALEVGLQTRSQYIIIVEDDAMPVQNLLSTLRIILGYKMPWRWLRSNSDVAFLKLFYPEKWQGFGIPEIPEVICIAVLMGMLSVYLHKKLQNINHVLILAVLFITWALYIVLVMYAVGRQHLIEMRKMSPLLHTVSQAPGCCTPAVLYNRVKARLLVRFLRDSKCSVKYPLDFALDDFSKKFNHCRYLVTPNLFTHIGVYSSLHSQPKHFREFDLLFEA